MTRKRNSVASREAVDGWKQSPAPNATPVLRQGDVWFVPVSKIPKTAVAKADKIVAYGEATGHHHSFDGMSAAQVMCVPGTDQMFVNVPEETMLTHQEHESYLFPAGQYEVVRVRELNLKEEVQRVMD